MTLDELFGLATGKPTLEDLLEEGEEVKEIREWPGYLISSLGRVISLHGDYPLVMSAWEHSTSRSVVELKKANTSSILSTEKLRKDYFDTHMECKSSVYEYVAETYADNEEVMEWLENDLEPLIKRRKPKDDD